MPETVGGPSNTARVVGSLGNSSPGVHPAQDTPDLCEDVIRLGDLHLALVSCVPPVRDRPFVHFTHVGNLPAVMASGYLKSDSLIRAESVMINECGNVQIKERRRNVAVSTPPGGVVADYVPFYFAPRSPMMYSISRGNVPTYSGGQGPLVYLWSHLSIVDHLGLHWVGSNGNCAHSLSVMTNDWAELESIVDWEVMTLRYWNDTPEDGDRMRRRMAELLVHRTFPVAAIAGIGAMNEEVAEVARSYTAGRIQVQVCSDWYY